MEAPPPPFRAFASKKKALVMIAAFTPMLILMAWPNVVISHDPPAFRVVFGAMIAFVSLILLRPVRNLLMRGPMLEVSADGFSWRAWSKETIPWCAVMRWQTKSYLGSRYLTVWLREPQRHPGPVGTRLARYHNSWIGQGDISIPEGGFTCSLDDISAAFARHAPLAPLPPDPRLARRLQRARQNRRDGA